MDVNKLMVGDWVYIVPLCEGREACSSQIAYLSHNAVYYGSDIGSWFADSERIEPIPLTGEILAKNGFNVHDKGKIWSDRPDVRCAYSKKFGEGFMCYSVDIEEIEEGGWFSFGIDRCLWQGVAINYVHELQHALRLAGLEEIANNFTI